MSPGSSPDRPGVPGTRRTQADRRATTRQALLEATIDAVVARGYAGATVAVIAEYAGVSQGALFNHFPSKADLLGAAVEYVFPLLIDDFAATAATVGAAPDAGPVTRAGLQARLRTVLELLWAAYQQPRLQAALELYMAARTDAELGARLAAVDGPHRARLDALALGLFPELVDQPGFLASVNLAIDAVQGFAIANLALTAADGSRAGRPPEPFLDHLATLLAGSMLPDAQPAAPAGTGIPS
jgi:AcrR family transcriptional regulator